MQHHWIVDRTTDRRGEVTIYDRIDCPPSPQSSRVLAEEIDGRTKSQAMKILKEMFAYVSSPEGSDRIFCREGAA